MKHLLGIIVAVALAFVAKAQTFEGCPDMDSHYTCYNIDSNNVHCYAEDTEADLDLDNDGVLDREYIFSTPDPDVGIEKKGKSGKGVIRNTEPDFDPYRNDPTDEK